MPVIYDNPPQSPAWNQKPVWAKQVNTVYEPVIDITCNMLVYTLNVMALWSCII